MEGIETSKRASSIKSSCCVSRCPDMEGIETDRNLTQRFRHLLVSVGAPTWRGLKLELHCSHRVSATVSVGAPTWRGLKRPQPVLSDSNPGVSRCPDMEGIETRSVLTSTFLVLVSVGAPTWRGLKPPKPTIRIQFASMSVGAPTWRGLKRGNFG